MTKANDKAKSQAAKAKQAEQEPVNEGKNFEDHGVYEPANTDTVVHNPYDTKVGGKPASMLADGTRPEVSTKPAAKTAE